jgi:resuscitation-promoting factor RpfA
MCPLGSRARYARASLGGCLAGTVPGAAKVEEPAEDPEKGTGSPGVRTAARAVTVPGDMVATSRRHAGVKVRKDRRLTSTIIRRTLGILAGLALTLGIALAGSLPAQAATTVWDTVAKCESGNRWHISTGNGYYGGLQFSSSTWKAFGGRKYGSQAHKATKAEQIAIARRVLASQGPGAWPTCSRRAGLTKKNGKADKKAVPATNPGVTKAKAKAKPVVKKAKPVVKKAPATAVKRIKVNPGDTLAKLANRYHVKGGWRGLWKLNKTLKNPNRIYVGQVLRIR